MSISLIERTCLFRPENYGFPNIPWSPWLSLVAQMVKNLPAIQETWVQKIPWRKERLPTPVFWPGEFHGVYSSWDQKESDMTERLSLSPSVYFCHMFLVSSASVRSMPFLSFIVPIFAWNVPLLSLIFLERSLVFLFLLFSSISLLWSLRKALLSLLAILWNYSFKWVYLSFFLCL